MIRTGPWSPPAASINSAKRLIGALLFATAVACAPLAPSVPKPPAPGLTLTPVDFAALPAWRADRHAAALVALQRACHRIKGMPAGRSLGGGGIAGVAGEWRRVCAAAARAAGAGDATARVFFETWFTPYAATAGDRRDGVFTGYYEAELRGARTPGGPYRVPIYGRPADLVTVDMGRFGSQWKGQRTAGRVLDGRLAPYPTRAEIEGGALKGRGLELLWVDDPVDAFFLHVQGSGRVVMEDGSVVRLGFAGHNGHPYVSIGRELVAAGIMAKKAVSMQSIRAWLAARPRRRAALMARNPSFIFFRTLDGAGPIGTQGAALTAGRSLAVDRRYVPLGVPIWLDIRDPLDPARPLRRLVVAQDTGGAIKGPVRGDLFWGFGAAAAQRAGHMRQKGRYYLLLPKPPGG